MTTGRDARSSPFHDLETAGALDGTELIALEQYYDTSRPWIGTRDVKLPINELNASGVFNVKSSLYGALGNGSHDDTAAIQAAVNAASAAGGGTVYFPAGTYIVSVSVASVGAFDPAKGIVVPSNVTLLGEGYDSCLQSSVVGADHVGFSFVINAGYHANTPQSNITIRGLRFRRTNALTGGEGPYDGAITMRLVDNLTVDDCWFYSSETGVGPEGCTHFMVRNCRGFSQGDATVRVSGYTGGASGLGSIVVDCTSDNAGYALDGTTSVPQPFGAVGSAIVVTQDDIVNKDCTVRNPRGQAVELGGSFDGVSKSNNIVVERLYSLTDVAGRVGTILVAATNATTVKNCEFRCYANTSSGVFISGNVIPNTNIEVDGCTFWTSNAGAPTASYSGPGVGVADISSFVTVRNCTAIGGAFTASSTCSDVLFQNCESILAPSQGFHIASGTRITLDNCRALNAGNDTTLPADYSRAGMIVDGVVSPTFIRCLALETRAGGARTQLYGYGSNGTAMAVAWKDNFTDTNNVTGQYQTTGTVTFVPPANTTATPTVTSGAAFTPSTLFDSMLYLTYATTGTISSVKMGPSTGTENTVYGSVAIVTSYSQSVRVPAGWKVVVTLVTTTATALVVAV